MLNNQKRGKNEEKGGHFHFIDNEGNLPSRDGQVLIDGEWVEIGSYAWGKVHRVPEMHEKRMYGIYQCDKCKFLNVRSSKYVKSNRFYRMSSTCKRCGNHKKNVKIMSWYHDKKTAVNTVNLLNTKEVKQ